MLLSSSFYKASPQWKDSIVYAMSFKQILLFIVKLADRESFFFRQETSGNFLETSGNLLESNWCCD